MGEAKKMIQTYQHQEKEAEEKKEKETEEIENERDDDNEKEADGDEKSKKAKVSKEIIEHDNSTDTSEGKSTESTNSTKSDITVVQISTRAYKRALKVCEILT